MISQILKFAKWVKKKKTGYPSAIVKLEKCRHNYEKERMHQEKED